MRLAATAGNQTIQHLGFNVDQHGNLRTRIDHVRGQWESFGYDQLDRVGCSRVGTGAPQDMAPGCPTRNEPAQSRYVYDAIGRLQSSPEGSYVYGAQVQHAPERLEGGSAPTTYSYDARGNRIREQGSFARGYSYTPAGKLKEVWREGQTPDEKLDLVSVDYDAFDNRIKKTTPSLTTVYLDRLYERRSPAGGASQHVFFVSVGGSVVAEVKPTSGDSSDARYVLSDHLGSPHLLTGEDGQVLDELSFTAFGKRRNAQWNNSDPVGPLLSTIGYTGHEADEDIGLVNMRGRQYDPKLGQFIQPDPIVQAPDYSQSWNRYAYVFNNPLRLVDPTGHESQQGGGGADDDGSALGAKSEPPNESKVVYHRGDLNARIHLIDDPNHPTPTTPTQNAHPNAAESKSLDTTARSTDAPGNSDGDQRQPRGSRDGARHVPMHQEWPDDGEWRKVPDGPSLGRVSNRLLEDPSLKGDPNAAVFWDESLGNVATFSPFGPEAAAMAVIGRLARAAKILGAARGAAIRFGQESVKNTFAHGPFAGKTIGEVAAGLRGGTISPNQLPIEVVIRNGQAIALNNRSLTALTRAGMQPTQVINRTGDAAAEALLNSHLRGGLPSDVIRIRGAGSGTSLIE